MSDELTLSSNEEFPLTQKSSQFSQSLRDWYEGRERSRSKVYAALHPMAEGLRHIDLSAKIFALGRFPGDYPSYNFCELENHHLRGSISAKHCHFERNDIEKVTYLHDTSRFGTFVNEELIGKNNSRILTNGDLISLCDPKFYVFIYNETKRTNDDYPQDLTSRFLISNLVIGEGAMGKVYIGKRRNNTSIAVAVKVIPKKHISVIQEHQKRSSSTEIVRREMEIMLSLKHPNCVRLEYMCESETMAYIVMEYVEGGELFTRIVAKENCGKGLGETLTKFYAWQILNAVDYLHKNGIVHRDIKAENVLLHKSDTYAIAKLADFGLSRIMECSLETFCGTTFYMAPELWREQHYGAKVDIWSLGTLIFTCMCGYPPFSSDYSDWPLKDQILKGRLIFNKSWENVSSTGRNFVECCLKPDPKIRFSAEEALSSEWFNDPVVEEAKNMIQAYAEQMDYCFGALTS